jgi:MFS family permease
VRNLLDPRSKSRADFSCFRTQQAFKRGQARHNPECVKNSDYNGEVIDALSGPLRAAPASAGGGGLGTVPRASDQEGTMSATQADVGLPGLAGAPAVRVITTGAARFLYLAGIASWFVPQGMLSVLVPWIIGEHLQLEGVRFFGYAYAVFTLPTVLLLLGGGYIADRYDPRRVLLVMQACLGLAATAVAVMAWTGSFGYLTLLAYLGLTGVVAAFVRPARESLLSGVAGEGLPRLVAAATGVQFGVQILGFAAAASVERFGVGPMFLIISLVLCAGAAGAGYLPGTAAQGTTPCADPPAGRAAPGMLRGPVRALRNLPDVSTVLALNLVVGICYTGAYFVIVPSLVLGFEGAGAGGLSAANAAFMLGTLAGTGGLMRLHGLAGHQITAFLSAVAWNGGALLLVALAPSLSVLLAGMFAWGIGSGLAIALGRTVVQQRAPTTLRARLLAMNMLAFLVGAPLGSLAFGLLAEPLGPRTAGALAAVLTLLALGLIAVRTDLRRVNDPVGAVAARSAGATAHRRSLLPTWRS